MARAARCRSLFAAALALGCGGRVIEEPQALHDGKSQYELRIETLSDDCSPPLVSGTVGPVLVWVATERGADGSERGANIPIYDSSLAPSSAAARADVSLDEPIEYEVAGWSGCPSVRLRTRMTPLIVDGRTIELELERSLSGTDDCAASPGRLGGCTSRRVFHFRWIRACGAESSASGC